MSWRAKRLLTGTVFLGCGAAVAWWSHADVTGARLLMSAAVYFAGAMTAALLLGVCGLKCLVEFATWPKAAPGDVACDGCGRPTPPDGLQTPEELLEQLGGGWLAVALVYAVRSFSPTTQDRGRDASARRGTDRAGMDRLLCRSCGLGHAAFVALLLGLGVFAYVATLLSSEP